MIFIRSILALSLLGGCALTTATPVTKDNPNPSGFIVNGTTTKIVAAGNQLTPITFSDPCSRYAVKFWAIFAENESKLNLNANGTMASLETKLDATEVPIKLIEVVGDVAKGLVGITPASGNPSSNAGQAATSAVYDIECGPDGEARLVLAGLIDSAPAPDPERAIRAAPTQPTNGGGNVSVVD